MTKTNVSGSSLVVKDDNKALKLVSPGAGVCVAIIVVCCCLCRLGKEE